MKIEVLYFSKNPEKHGIYSETTDFLHFFFCNYHSLKNGYAEQEGITNQNLLLRINLNDRIKTLNTIKE